MNLRFASILVTTGAKLDGLILTSGLPETGRSPAVDFDSVRSVLLIFIVSEIGSPASLL